MPMTIAVMEKGDRTMNPNRELIIKVLEHCAKTDANGCYNCPRECEADCFSSNARSVLSLIKELTKEVADWEAIAEQYQKQFEDCYEENERLKDISCKASARIYELQRELDSPKRGRTKTKRHDEPYQYGIKFTEEGDTIE